MKPSSTYLVYSDEQLVLTMHDQPGALMSTASLPRRRKPVQHPFLSASAHLAEYEHELQDLLSRSSSLEEFCELLSAAGFRVEREADDGSNGDASPL